MGKKFKKPLMVLNYSSCNNIDFVEKLLPMYRPKMH